MSLETENYIDAPNHPNFPPSEVAPGRPYHETTVFGFSRD
jgi:aldose 1-epimerase